MPEGLGAHRRARPCGGSACRLGGGGSELGIRHRRTRLGGRPRLPPNERVRERCESSPKGIELEPCRVSRSREPHGMEKASAAELLRHERRLEGEGEALGVRVDASHKMATRRAHLCDERVQMQLEVRRLCAAAAAARRTVRPRGGASRGSGRGVALGGEGAGGRGARRRLRLLRRHVAKERSHEAVTRAGEERSELR